MVDLCRDSAKRASTMALASPSVPLYGEDATAPPVALSLRYAGTIKGPAWDFDYASRLGLMEGPRAEPSGGAYGSVVADCCWRIQSASGVIYLPYFFLVGSVSVGVRSIFSSTP